MEFKAEAEIIIGLKKADLDLRNKLIESGELWDGYNEKMNELHNRNAKILETIIDDIGCPTNQKLGREANDAAWLVIQHSIALPAFMKKCQELLETELDQDDTYSVNLAYLSDRISVFEGNPQLYGTQFDWDENGELSPQLYDDLDQVNERRHSLGLNSLEEQTEVIRKQAIVDNDLPPKDLQKRKEEINQWRKSVGWIE